MKRLFSLFFLCFISILSYSQYDTTEVNGELKIESKFKSYCPGPMIKGTVYDHRTNEILPFATVKMVHDGVVIHATQTDFEGEFKFTPPKESRGVDIIATYVGYEADTLWSVRGGGLTVVNLRLDEKAEVVRVCTCSKRPPSGNAYPNFKDPNSHRMTTFSRKTTHFRRR
jgi:hypothetical protein